MKRIPCLEAQRSLLVHYNSEFRTPKWMTLGQIEGIAN